MGCSRLGSTEEEASLAPTIPTLPQTQTSRSIRGPPLLDYPSYMARLLAVEQPSPLASPGSTSPEASPTATAEEKVRRLQIQTKQETQDGFDAVHLEKTRLGNREGLHYVLESGGHPRNIHCRLFLLCPHSLFQSCNSESAV